MSLQESRKTRAMILAYGLAGVAGALVLFAGDMLFYYQPGSDDFLANMAAAAPGRVVASGLCALLAAWLYALGSGQVYLALAPAAAWLRALVFGSFAAVMIAYGVIHGAYVAIVVAARNAAAAGQNPAAAVELAWRANEAMRDVTMIPFAVFTVFFTWAVLTGRSLYPRWVLVFSPVVLYLLKGPLVSRLSGGWLVVLGGGYLNLLLLVFFAVSTTALLRRR